ncbi:hypothetical protein GS597_19650 [Synechococcales cyanobacterium C]|uniref:Uncharacterized protein n=1 Tax=Petrachloros mirabilis ULC683 TaxID=2781853 RepID=A0A8K2A9Y2_9CYAN|nr:hypothetical protein [Petrachloros mirabilis]NCJ08680.1 hypothetical protein [Petrachloros mirabilis ULC683]
MASPSLRLQSFWQRHDDHLKQRQLLQHYLQRVRETRVCDYPPLVEALQAQSLEAESSQFFDDLTPAVSPELEIAPEPQATPLDLPTLAAPDEPAPDSPGLLDAPESQNANTIPTLPLSGEKTATESDVDPLDEKTVAEPEPDVDLPDEKAVAEADLVFPVPAAIPGFSPSLAEQLDAEDTQLPPRVRYERHLLRLYIRAVAESGVCHYPGLLSHLQSQLGGTVLHSKVKRHS